MTDKRYRMINTNLADENGRIYYNIQRADGINICQVYGKNNAKSLISELNELLLENQHLREILDIGKTNVKDIVDVLNIQQSRINELNKENKELKEENQQLRELLEYGLEVSQVEIDEELRRIKND